MPRDIDDKMPSREHQRAHGEISSDEMLDPDMSEHDLSDPDMDSPGSRREQGERRSSWDDDEDMHEGYR
jgi:hypothetical protein